MNRFIKVSDAAKMLGVNKKTLYRWIREGTVPAYRLGRCIRLDQDFIGGFKCD